MSPDFLIVGSGLTGAVIARTLSDQGNSVLVLERRSHGGGNVYDHVHESGIRVHTYGPHYFRTNSDSLWAFVNRFASFHKYEPELTSLVDGRYESWPVTADYINRVVGENWEPGFHGEPDNFEEASLAMMPRAIYEKFVRGYSEKQWGVPCTNLSASLAKRFEVREDGETRLMRHKHQGIPAEGYAAMMENMLSGIPLILNCDYSKYRSEFDCEKSLIFTGPIDEFFNFEYGRLGYRGQSRKHAYLPGVGFVQPCGQVNNPDPKNGPHIRTLEWKHMLPARYAAAIKGTVLTDETPVTPEDPDNYEYPFPDAENARLYQRYRLRAEATPGLLICGRLGEYQYYDMDRAIERALRLAERLVSTPGVRVPAA